jgi:hypothetical protein
LYSIIVVPPPTTEDDPGRAAPQRPAPGGRPASGRSARGNDPTVPHEVSRGPGATGAKGTRGTSRETRVHARQPYAVERPRDAGVRVTVGPGRPAAPVRCARSRSGPPTAGRPPEARPRRRVADAPPDTGAERGRPAGGRAVHGRDLAPASPAARGAR